MHNENIGSWGDFIIVEEEEVVVNYPIHKQFYQHVHYANNNDDDHDVYQY